MINLYSFFHLNLNFSALDNIPEVLDTAYFNLLNEIDKQEFEIGIEASGYTLEMINKFKPEMINKINYLISKKKIFFIGSGYHQIISPLFPKKFVDKNIELGISTYSNFLEKKPKLYLVNEQVFNNSIISNYTKFNIYDLIIDSNLTLKNLTLNKTHKPRQYLYNSKNVNIYWSHTILSQILQDYIYDKINSEEYYKSLEKINLKSGFYCFYGSDAETFDYRVKRYDYEKNSHKRNEYQRIFKLIENFKNTKKFKFIDFNSITKIKKNYINIKTDLNNPYLVKKQEKYNVSRWLNTSKYDLYINNLILINEKRISNNWKLYKRECLYLLSSDLRTHPNIFKINKANNIIKKLKLKKLKRLNLSIPKNNNNEYFINKIPSLISSQITCKSFKRSDLVNFKKSNNYYSFHSVIADFEKCKKMTDLNEKFYQVKNNIFFSKFKNSLISYVKKLDFKDQSVSLSINFKYNKLKKGYIRFPISFLIKKDKKISLSYLSSNTKNEELNYYKEIDYEYNQYEFFSVNSLIYSTNGKIEISNSKEKIIFQNDINYSNTPFMIKTYNSAKNILFRVYYSLQELDDTKYLKSPTLDIKSKIYIK